MQRMHDVMPASLCTDASLFRMLLMLERKRESGRFLVLKGFLLLISESCHINLSHTDNIQYGITNSWTATGDDLIAACGVVHL